jgi:predicted glycoside hydrolase/deacetylase ChbG (UPF0249 family)
MLDDGNSNSAGEGHIAGEAPAALREAMSSVPSDLPEQRLVVCVDDAALDATITRSVLELAAAGRITAASAMVGSPHWPVHAAALAAAPGIDLGLHLDLTEFCDPRPLPALWLLAYARLLDQTALRRSIDAQIERFVRHAGRLPDHLDGHQHVQQLPGVREALLDAIGHHWAGRRERPWMRTGRRPAGMATAYKARVIEALGARRLAALAAERGVATNPALVGVYGFDANAAAYLARLDGWLTAAPDGALLMTHPADGDSVPAHDPIATARRAEHATLRSEAFDALMGRHRLRLVRGSAVYGDAY